MRGASVRGRRGGRRGESASSVPMDNNKGDEPVGTAVPVGAKTRSIPVSPVDSTGGESVTEADSAMASISNEDVSSGASESGGSDKSSGASSSGSSAISDDMLEKSKEELIQTAQELDMQFKDLIKIYQHEKRLFLDKSVHLLESGLHPEWTAKLNELHTKRQEALKTASERRRLRVESLLAEYDFTTKNVADEFEAAEKEIIDEFTNKRKRRGQLQSHDKPGGTPIHTEMIPRVALQERHIQSDLRAIRRLEEQTAILTSSTSDRLDATSESGSVATYFTKESNAEEAKAKMERQM